MLCLDQQGASMTTAGLCTSSVHPMLRPSTGRCKAKRARVIGRYRADKRTNGDARLNRTAPALGSSDSDTSSIDWGASESSQPVRACSGNYAFVRLHGAVALAVPCQGVHACILCVQCVRLHFSMHEYPWRQALELVTCAADLHSPWQHASE